MKTVLKKAWKLIVVIFVGGENSGGDYLRGENFEYGTHYFDHHKREMARYGLFYY